MLADPATYAAGVPHQELARRRREAPVSWVDEPALAYHSAGDGRRVRQGTGYWAVTRHADVIAAARSPGIFSSAAKGAFLADPRTPEDLQRARQLLVNMDAPEHRRIRRHITAAFTPQAVQAMGAGIRQHAAALVARAVAAGTFDAVACLAAELPLLVLVDLLGMPRADRGLLLRWSNSLVGFDDPEYGGGSLDRYRQTFREALGYAAALAADRRRRPGDDLVSRLVHGEVDGDRLTDPEFAQLWLLLVVAGNETTRHLLSGSLLALAAWPDQRGRLAADPAATPRAVDELLRYVSPVMQFRRTALADTELGGQRIAAGDKVVLYFVSANRDEGVFRDPDSLDLRRRPNPHLAFGVGPHYCVGSHIAHLEAQVLLDAMRPHLRRLCLAGPVVRMESTFMSGIKSLPMAFGGG
jgi:cytochrome P450